MNIDLVAKRIELAREIMPEFADIAFLWREGADATFLAHFEDQLNRAAEKFGFKWHIYIHSSRPEAFEPAFQAMQQQGYKTVYLLATPITFGNRKLIGELALKYGIRLIAEQQEFAQAGALLSYGFHAEDVQRPMAARVDAILRGARPDTLPIEQVTKLHLVINLKTAHALHVDISPDILVRADEVIE